MTSARSLSAFPSSNWSLIAHAAGDDPEPARQALADLCRRYWYPVYAFVRRQLENVHDAEDATQGFFAHLLANNVVAAVDPARGRFRTYLLACCKNYLAKHRRAERAEKHGGRVAILNLDFVWAVARYAREPIDASDPDRLFLRRWAFTLLEETFAELEQEYQADGRSELFARLRSALIDDQAPTYAAIGQEIGMSESAVKKAAQRMRERFGVVLRRRVADTLDDSTTVEDEIRDLFAAVRSSRE
jgi:RNA polymerase sigma-70 factor (ECF subfamily)